MKLFVSCLALFTTHFYLHAQTHRDPSADIRVTELSNGLRVIYAPSERSETVQIRVRVDSGRWSEDRAGIAHLLEHYMFKDAKLDKDMTYLEVIKENGGQGNAYVDDRSTTFYATVPPAKAKWIVGLFGKMLINKSFVPDEVELAKKPVYLEIGQPNPFHYFGALIGMIFPSVSLFPGFWQTEFGFESPNRQSTPDQITTATLRSDEIEKFYRKFYHAQNMTLFLAGHFDLKSIHAEVDQSFSQLPQGKDKGVKIAALKAKIRPYIRASATSGTPHFEVGTKVADISREQAMSTSVYLEYLSHRLMKDLRNKRGETYTVIPRIDIRYKNGTASVSMEAPPESYYTNLNLVRNRLENEARRGEISIEAFHEARELYGHRFDLTDKDSDTMMSLALKTDEYLNDYGDASRTPYQIFSSLDHESYKENLKAVFSPSMKFETTAEPPLVFRYEEWLLLLIGIMGWGYIAKMFFAKHFIYTKLRWVRKIAYAPAFLVQIGATLFAILASSIVLSVVYRLWYQIPFGHSSFLIEDYLSGQIGLGLLFFCFQACFGLCGRKVMIHGEELWIKSLGYRSSIIPFADIKQIRLANPIATLLHPARMWKIKHRYLYYDLAFWRPGLLVELKDGRAYFLGLRHPKVAAEELQMYCSHAPKNRSLTAVA